MGLGIDEVVRAINVHMPAPIGWFGIDQLGAWISNCEATLDSHTENQLQEGWATIALLIPHEHRSLLFRVPELEAREEMPRQHLTTFLRNFGLPQAYKGTCREKSGQRFQLMLYGPAES